jgi:CTP:molybdopterin cytidylyltransferase MocA
MGKPKPRRDFAGRPMIARVVEALLASEVIACPIVVTGHAAEQVEAALSGLPCTIVRNDHYEIGEMVSSVRLGVQSLPASTPAFLIVLGDQPMVMPETIRQLARAWVDHRPAIVLPRDQGRRGHPVLLDGRCRERILSLENDQTLKDVTTALARESLEIDVADPGILADIDTPADYRAALARWRGDSARHRRSVAKPPPTEQ